jgi:hypothetical protein
MLGSFLKGIKNYSDSNNDWLTKLQDQVNARLTIDTYKTS